eukprot:CAMPEP_0182515416 /NCGR_PEP_ID=MMETSP1321-20130603/38033_1 /TAXON_ID=91990 /ORGANISM="Bolidomonas sp., Strain RCC1657" /LENGTH=44 /DNA_ID= /DNA_START= /DNA_END= /DNA_ORIENTATION=
MMLRVGFFVWSGRERRERKDVRGRRWPEELEREPGIKDMAIEVG